MSTGITGEPIKSLNNAIVTNLDVNSFGLASAFQPEVRSNSTNPGEYSVDFQIRLVRSGTNTPVELIDLLASGVDIDGDSGPVREFIQLSGAGFTSYTVDGNTALTPSLVDSQTVRFESTTSENLANITAEPTHQGSALFQTNVQTINYRAGITIDNVDSSAANQRLNSLFFDCVEYDTAVTQTSVSVPDVLLVKRITAINGFAINPNDSSTLLNQFVDDTTSPYQADDNASGWPNGYLKGAIDAGPVKPGDTIEYTVYFMNAGETFAEDVRICDRIQPNQSFQLGTYNSGSADVQLQIGDGAGGNTFNLTAVNDGGDRAQFARAGTPVSRCNLPGINENGTLVLDVTGTTGTPNLPKLPQSTGVGAPNASYGFFRFEAKVDE